VRVTLDVAAVPAKPAGAGRYIVEVARRLPALATTTLVTRRSDVARWREWSPDATLAPLAPDQRVARLLHEGWQLGRSDVARASDVWHSPHYTMPHRGSTPTVVTVHDLTFFTHPRWHERSKVVVFQRAIRYAAAHASAIISVSQFTADLFTELFSTHPPVVVAPHGVDLDRFSLSGPTDDALLRAAGLDASRPFVLFVGTIEPRKGLDVLLAAFAALASSHPDLELWIAGQAGWGESPLDDAVATPGARERVRRLGYVDDAVLPALLRRAAVVAYPSRGEGFGLPVLEALACGAPVVTSRATVMEEVAGDAALYAGVGDVDELAAQIDVALALTSDERRVRQRLARERAELFTWDRSLAQHLVAYHQARGE